MRIRGLLSGTVAVLALAPAAAHAAPPANDTLAQAQVLAANGTSTTATLVDATAGGGDPTLFGNGERDVWFKWTAPDNRVWTFDTCGPQSTSVTVLRYLDGGPPSQVGTYGADLGNCAGAGTTHQGALSFTAVAGHTYDFLVGQLNADTAGPFTVEIRPGPESQVDYQAGLGGTFNGDAYGPIADISCSIDDGPLTPCNTTQSLASLVVGAHTLAAVAKSGSDADPTPAVTPITIDRSAPETAVSIAGADTSAPAFTLTSDDANARFACTIDGLPTVSCPGGTFSIPGMCAGAHTISVVAIDQQGNRDATPATASFGATSGACGTPRARTDANPAPFAAGNVDAAGRFAVWHFEYGPTTAYGYRTDERLAGGALSDPDFALKQLLAIDGAPSSTTHYRVAATLSDGTTFYGADQSMTQSSVPVGASLAHGTPSADTTSITVPFTLGTLAEPLETINLRERPAVAQVVVLGGPVATALVNADTSTHSGTLTVTGLAPDTAYQLNMIGTTPVTILHTEPFVVRTAALPAAPASNPPATTPPAGAPPVVAKPVVKPIVAGSPLGKLTADKARLPVLRKGTWKLKVACKAACALKLSAKVGKSTVASAKGSAKKAGAVTLKPKLTLLGKRKLKHARKATVVFTVTAVDAKGKALGSAKKTVRFAG